MRKAWVYILRCSDGSYYTGHTTDLPVRIRQHQAGNGSRYTRARLPVTLVFSQEFPDAHAAFHRERQVKRWPRRKKEALVRDGHKAQIELSESRQEARQ